MHKLSVSLSGLSRDVNANPRRLGGREALQDVMASVSLGVLLVLSTHVIKCTSGFNSVYCLPVVGPATACTQLGPPPPPPP
eukprot:SAG25_NODE_3016_length_1267_cov_1.040240_1_plen_80_part_10